MRNIDDKDYIECLSSDLYRRNYSNWRQRMLSSIDDIVDALANGTVEDVMEQKGLSARDIALLVRLQYFTEEEVERYELRRIEKTVPL